VCKVPYVKNIIAIITVMLLIVPVTFGQQKKPFEPEDLLRQKNLSDPQISPSGDWIAFVVSSFIENHRSGSDIWLVSRNGQILKQVMLNPERGTSSRWSPDGSILAFISRTKQDEYSQLYFYSIETGRLERKTSEEGNISDFKWSPDKKSIAFARSDALTPEMKAKKAKGDDAFVVDKYPWHTRLWILDVETGRSRLLTHQDQTVFHFNWSPDSRWIAALSSAIPTAEGHEYQSHLGLINAQTGDETVLNSKTNALADPCFSPDGKWIAYIGPIGTFKERGIIKAISVQGGEPLELLREYPGNVWDLTWHPREKKILAAVARGPHNYLITLDLEGRAQDIFEMDHSMIPYWGHYWSVSSEDGNVAFLSETEKYSREVWLYDVHKNQKNQVTHFNDYMENIELGSVQSLTWVNTEEKAQVFGILVLPSKFDPSRKYPLVVTLHGGPAYNWGIGNQVSSWAQLFASNGYMVLLPNFRGSSGSGMDWMMANVRNWGRGPMSDVMSGVDHLIKKGWVDKDRLFIQGGSYGGYLTFWIITQTPRFKAAFARAGIANLATEYALTDEPTFSLGYFLKSPYEDPEIYKQDSPLTYVSQVKTPLLIAHGERDLRVPISQAYEFYSALKHYGAPVEMVVYPREPHGIGEYAHQMDLLNRMLAWFKQHDVK
jgi:dipeptidyl aminopeptidase/acylaminoacyl peptidase